MENHITWAPNHQAIQFVTDFNAKPHYNGFYAYDPAKKTITFYYTSEEGQLTVGTATPDADGKTLHQEFDVTQPNGGSTHIRSTMVRDGSDAYVFSVFMNQDGEWKSNCFRLPTSARCEVGAGMRDIINGCALHFKQSRKSP